MHSSHREGDQFRESVMSHVTVPHAVNGVGKASLPHQIEARRRGGVVSTVLVHQQLLQVNGEHTLTVG